ncbi:hypothetical protein MIND_00394500 [Mycena indigotica]|uniref:Uncharacterized protein n=1 Tax=Mycena indigotica TaxID=2126181 RepID=A0A8H6T3A7_9AGAR|nr:uncharacterized protein MIND_00394500 [Mycena indigotica]KAF7310208.1 hypothetical protein MIND_00394500 [Mycena indigotica]
MAPPVVVYVVVAVSVVGAALAFKEFVYEPHIAPRVERWAEEFVSKRKAKKAAKQRTREAVPVPGSSAGTETGKVGEGRRSMTVTDLDTKNTYELETMVAHEVSQWREQVQGVSTLRQRRPASALDESNVIIPYDPMAPTHVLFDDSLSVGSPGSSISSRVPTPLSNSTLSNQSFRTPPPPVAFQAPPTPDPSVHPSSPAPSHNPFEDGSATSEPFSSPAHVPSLSLSHPVDLAADAEHDLELLSAPSSSAPSDSSRPVSPSAFSESAFSTTDEQVFHSFTMSPSMTLGSTNVMPGGPSFRVPASPAVNSLGMSSGSDIGDDELERWSNAGSDITGSESSWTSAGVRSR